MFYSCDVEQCPPLVHFDQSADATYPLLRSEYDHSFVSHAYSSKSEKLLVFVYRSHGW